MSDIAQLEAVALILILTVAAIAVLHVLVKNWDNRERMRRAHESRVRHLNWKIASARYWVRYEKKRDNLL